MPFMIRTYFAQGSAQRMVDMAARHMNYLDERASLLLAVGALLNDDGSVGDGGLFLVDVEDRGAAEALARNDPFFLEGVVERYVISRWRKGYLDGRRFVRPTQ